MIISLILVMSLSLALGGGTTSGFMADVIIQLVSLALLSYACLTMRANAVEHLCVLLQSGPGRFAAALLVCLIGLCFIQLIPLPMTWTASGPLDGEGSTGSISRVPHATGAALASLLPPIAVFVFALTCGVKHRQTAIMSLAIVSIVSLVMGFLQVVQGPGSTLRLYEFTNRLDAVGFFANRNHFASLLCILLVLVSVWLLSMLNSQTERLSPIAASAALACLVAVLTGILLARSRAGVFLAIFAIGAVTVIYWLDRRRLVASDHARHRPPASRWLALGLITSLAIAVQLGLARTMTRFDRDPLEDLRLTFTETGASLALASMPFGTGIASFVQSYATFEQTSNMFSGFANRAHNDWVEFAIEGGLPAIILMVCFLFWFASRIWSCPQEQGHHRLQHIAGSLIIGVLLLHSVVDYPFRTTALATAFALACALLLPPPPERVNTDADEKKVDDNGQSYDTHIRRQAPAKWSPASGGQNWPDAWK